MFNVQANNHRVVIESIKAKCADCGAPEFMFNFLISLSRKTSFSIKDGALALLQPFNSGRFSAEDALNIAEATGYFMCLKDVQTIDQYEDAIKHYFVKLD